MQARLSEPRRRILAAVGALALTMAAYGLWARPLQLRWGATEAEAGGPMPGDELNPTPSFLATRAIEINGAPADIWPWLMQMGYDRAGLYGFDLFEKVGSPRTPFGVDRILPQFQDLKVGDPVPVTPLLTMTFQAIAPREYMVWSTEDGHSSITWALHASGPTTTRLISRTRWNYHWTQPGRLALDALDEFTDHLAMRKILQGVKGRVEGSIQPKSDINIEFALYLGSALVFLWALISIVRLPLTWISWLIGLAGGWAWLATWYAPASLWVGAAFAMLVVWAIRVEERDVKRARMRQEQDRNARTAKPRA